MDLKIFDQTYAKVIADALKIGSLDERTDSILKDVVKNLRSEINRKRDAVQRTLGEISQLESTHAIIVGVVQNHTRLEEQKQLDMKKHSEQLEGREEPTKKASKKKTTKKSTKKQGSPNNRFVGDSSK